MGPDLSFFSLFFFFFGNQAPISGAAVEFILIYASAGMTLSFFFVFGNCKGGKRTKNKFDRREIKPQQKRREKNTSIRDESTDQKSKPEQIGENGIPNH